MIKQKENKNVGQFEKIGSFIFILGIAVISFKFVYNQSITHQENKHIDEFIEETKVIDDVSKVEIKEDTTSLKKETTYSYIGVLEIPSISLKKGFVDISSKYNNVNYNLEILKDSDMPNITNGNFIIASHSGTGRIAYFKNLDKLKIDDISYIYYDGIKYTYKTTNIYDIEKTGSATIHRNKNKTTLTMITCRSKTNKQIVVIAELVSKDNY